MFPIHNDTDLKQNAVNPYFLSFQIPFITHIYHSLLNSSSTFLTVTIIATDHLCGLVVRVPGCTIRGLGFDSRRYQIFCLAMCLKRGPQDLIF
jgi:hypothetical protein